MTVCEKIQFNEVQSVSSVELVQRNIEVQVATARYTNVQQHLGKTHYFKTTTRYKYLQQYTTV